MTNFILLVLCLGLGFMLRRTNLFDERSPLVLNNLLVYFFIPILTIYHVPKIDFEWNLVWLSITPFLIYLSSFLFFRGINKFHLFEKKTEGALIMTSGIGSISFVGFPIFEMLHGEEGLSYGIILSLAGTFVVFNTVGVSTGLYYSNRGSKVTGFWRKLFTFPPLIAFMIACIINLSGFQYSESMDIILKKLSAPFSVLALLAIGMQMDFSIDKQLLKNLILGQLHKLIIAPFLIYLIMVTILDMNNMIATICILGAAIGSMNSISIVSAQMGLDSKLSTLMPAIGIPVSIPWLLFIDWLIH